MNLHRYHCGAQASRLQVDLPDGSMTWRADGRAPLAAKGAIAHRLAVCWNVLEGMPTELLELGLLKRLCDAVAANDITTARAVLSEMDQGTDCTDGRLHDCKACAAKETNDD